MNYARLLGSLALGVALAVPAQAATREFIVTKGLITVRVSTDDGEMRKARIVYSSGPMRIIKRLVFTDPDDDPGSIDSKSQIQLVPVKGERDPVLVISAVSCPGRDCHDATKIFRVDRPTGTLQSPPAFLVTDTQDDGFLPIGKTTIVGAVRVGEGDHSSAIPIRDASTIRYYYTRDTQNVARIFSTDTVYRIGSDAPPGSVPSPELPVLGCFQLYRTSVAIACGTASLKRGSVDDLDDKKTKTAILAYRKTLNGPYEQSTVTFSPAVPGAFTPSTFALSATKLVKTKIEEFNAKAEFADIFITEYADSDQKRLLDFDFFTFRPESKSYHQVRRFLHPTALHPFGKPVGMIALTASTTLIDDAKNPIIFMVSDAAKHAYLMDLDFDPKASRTGYGPFNGGDCLIFDARNYAKVVSAGASAGGFSCPR
ncbi:MAG: hypothetical protein NVSMB31_00450 [Vulcanimicrobiaceae bacterium]